MRRLALIVLSATLAAGSLGACSSSDSSSSALPKVAGKFGAKPKLTLDKGTKPSTKLDFEVLTKGKGPVVKKGDLLVADYLGEVYKTGKVFDNSYDRKVPAAFPIGVGKVITGWDKSLVGVPAGSRVLMVIPPKLGYGKKGNPQAKIKPTDTLVFVVDVIASYAKKGVAPKTTPVTNLPKTLPVVTGALGTEPKVTVAAGTAPPTKPSVTVLAQGTGPAVTQGKLLVVEYVAVDWTGAPLDNTWATGPIGQPVGTGQSSPFDLLVGVATGSRVLLQVPAQTGTDPKTKSVAVAIDIVGLHGPAKESAK